MSLKTTSPSRDNLLQLPCHHHSSWPKNQKNSFLKSTSTISISPIITIILYLQMQHECTLYLCLWTYAQPPPPPPPSLIFIETKPSASLTTTSISEITAKSFLYQQNIPMCCHHLLYVDSCCCLYEWPRWQEQPTRRYVVPPEISTCIQHDKDWWLNSSNSPSVMIWQDSNPWRYATWVKLLTITPYIVIFIYVLL